MKRGSQGGKLFQPKQLSRDRIASQVEKIRERQKGAINARQLKFLQARVWGFRALEGSSSLFGLGCAECAWYQCVDRVQAMPCQSYKPMTKPGPMGRDPSAVRLLGPVISLLCRLSLF